ncbi:hypothetical protein [Fimbriimonas ginsengisoli]|uniref:Uncharacterized protein n=1 Tax=Fimbriimonas ginsengisoli Gsoil 348 TaxID=661478 RepID=A0A068NIW5_FIMGI|nr:hypothetical protein [Fimbriimonas ginsengisoli]AIE83528.1 hypothetical protein OP10G_0160 [Fimbriimonas ginsengisoli Gsoil 348]
MRLRSKVWQLAADNAQEVINDQAPVFGDDFEILEADAAKGGLMRIRQRATRADARNKNRRIYPREVLQLAIDTAREHAAAGAMLCEMSHPEVAQVRGRDFYTHNPERTTARVDEISDVADDGWVYVTRTILDTPEGRKLAARYKAGRAPGISTRFRMKARQARLGADQVVVAETMQIFTWDDVENPAVDGTTDFELLSDADLASLSDPFVSDPPNPTGKPMKLKALRQAFLALIVAQAAADEVLTARSNYHAAFTAASDADRAAEQPFLLQADATLMATDGYDVTTPAPVAAPAARQNNGLSADEIERFRRIADRDQAREAAEVNRLALDSAITAIEGHASLTALAQDQREHVLGRVRTLARIPEDVERLVTDEIDSMNRLLSDERLRGMGFVRGTTTIDPANPTGQTRVTREIPKWMEGVDRLNLAADDYRRSVGGDVNPDDHATQRRRAFNMERFINPLIEQVAQDRGQYRTAEEWFRASDALFTGGEQAFGDAISGMARDNTTTSQLFNQPTIMTFLLVQQFQDMKGLQFVSSFGPGAGSGAGGFEQASGGIGSVLRIPVEYYTPPTGYGTFSGTYDAGLLTPENTGIDEMTVQTAWLPFAPSWRRIAASLTRDTVQAMGNGPLSYMAIARSLLHMAMDKSRRIDKAIFDEMLAISDEYTAVTAAGDSATTGNNKLPNNSVYNGGGSISVNLNTTKTAATAIAATDPGVTYGATVVGALRLLTRGSNTAANYCGTANGPDPIVRPRAVVDLNAAGQVTTTTKNPFTVTAPAAQVIGYLDANGDIQAIPGVPNPTCAIDWENGILVFNAASGITGAAGVMTTTVTVTYAYAVNFDNFIVNNPNLAAGQSLENYLNGLFLQFDRTAALMGSAPRFKAPNLGIMSLNAAPNMTAAQIFYNYQSPKGTNLFPTDDYFAERTGVAFARHNSPWNGKDRRILFTSLGTTKYGIDTPMELRGPYPAYDTNGKIVARDIYYAEENSVICTPQVQNQAGTVLNPVSRTVILR